jgi:hypothetical protein
MDGGRGYMDQNMHWDIIVHEEDGYVEIVTRGVADGDGSLRMAKAIMQTMRGNRMTRALIDHRGVESVVSNPVDIYSRPKIFRLIGTLLNIRIAEVINPEHEEHFKFFETVCINQGYRFSVFYEKDKALVWLLGRPQPG